MSEQELFSGTQQEDIRGLLKTVDGFLREYFPSELFSRSEVLVSPDLAAIVVSGGLEPLSGNEKIALEDAEKAGNHVTKARILAKSSEARSKIVKAISLFLTELSFTGSPLFGNMENQENAVLIHFKLMPNDVIGAENKLNKLIVRLKKSKADANKE